MFLHWYYLSSGQKYVKRREFCRCRIWTVLFQVFVFSFWLTAKLWKKSPTFVNKRSRRQCKTYTSIWNKVFTNGPSKRLIRPYPFKFFKGCQILLCLFVNVLSLILLIPCYCYLQVGLLFKLNLLKLSRSYWEEQELIVKMFKMKNSVRGTLQIIIYLCK